MEGKEKIMEVRNLKVRFYTYEGVVKAVEGVNLDVYKGETLGIVGETGSGKSVTTYAMMGLVPPPGRIEEGDVILYKEGKALHLTRMKESQLRMLRGSELSRIFQEPKAALNPVFKVGDQVAEVILLHRKREMLDRALKSLEKELKEEKGLKKFLLSIERNLIGKALKNENNLLLKITSRIPLLKRLYWSPLLREVRREVERLFSLMGIPDPHKVYDMYLTSLAVGCNSELL